MGRCRGCDRRRTKCFTWERLLRSRAPRPAPVRSGHRSRGHLAGGADRGRQCGAGLARSPGATALLAVGGVVLSGWDRRRGDSLLPRAPAPDASRAPADARGGRRNAHGQCLKLLRHEIGHTVQHAFELQRRRRFTETFGRSSRAYPDYYRPNPASRRYVLHLDYWYAQAHPGRGLRGDLRGLAHARLALAQALCGLARGPAQARVRGRADGRAGGSRGAGEAAGQGGAPLERLKHHAARPLRGQAASRFSKRLTSAVYDADLNRLFEEEGASRRRSESAASFLRRNRARIRRMVSGEHRQARVCSRRGAAAR